jgi:EAL domain-containing protein (putative c-di-GMP-specific phosphodiesterase class I)
VRAIETASRLGLRQRLSINFFPNAVYEPATCIRLTLMAAQTYGVPAERLIFETAESEQVRDHAHLTRIFRDYRSRGFLTAIDDFGSGYAGLSLLADFQPDLLKLDMALIRGIHRDPARRAIVSGIVRMARDLGCTVLAEDVETAGEFRHLSAIGVPLFQGYLFGRPRLEELGTVPPDIWREIA